MFISSELFLNSDQLFQSTLFNGLKLGVAFLDHLVTSSS